MKKVKLFLILGLLVTIVLALTILPACKTATTETTVAETTAAAKELQVFFANQQTAHPFWNTVAKGVNDAAEHFGGIKVTMGGPTAPDDAESVRIIEAAIASGMYDAMIIPPIVPTMYTPSINKAVDAGILVICICDDAPESKRTASVFTSDELAAKAGGEKLAELTGGKANINIISGIPDQAAILNRIKGFTDAIAAFPDMKITSTDNNEGDMALGVSKLKARLISDKDVNAFFGTMGDAGPALVAVYEQFKDRLAGTHSVMFDDVEQTLDGIRNGIIDATIVQSQYNWGYGAMYQIHRILQKGLEPSAVLSYPPVVLVTKENVDSYAALTMDPKVWLDLAAQEK